MWERHHAWCFAANEAWKSGFVVTVAVAVKCGLSFVWDFGWHWPTVANWLLWGRLLAITFCITFALLLPYVRWQLWKSNQVKPKGPHVQENPHRQSW